ncbi:MAG: hypothetical protein ACI8Y4_002727 [Candidatus Poriferisodalaceae bacterium]|jgi:hypothetical protein
MAKVAAICSPTMMARCCGSCPNCRSPPLERTPLPTTGSELTSGAAPQLRLVTSDAPLTNGIPPLKRMLDVAGAVATLVVTAPVLLLSLLMTRLTSGPNVILARLALAKTAPRLPFIRFAQCALAPALLRIVNV